MSFQRKIASQLILSELTFTTSRSSGPGGQNVNKVNSKVTLRWDVAGSQILTPEEKDLIQRKLRSKMTVDGELLITAQDTRSQSDNREDALEKLDQFLIKAFEKRKARKATKPSKSSVQNRIQKKKKQGEKKKWRQRPI